MALFFPQLAVGRSAVPSTRSAQGRSCTSPILDRPETPSVGQQGSTAGHDLRSHRASAPRPGYSGFGPSLRPPYPALIPGGADARDLPAVTSDFEGAPALAELALREGGGVGAIGEGSCDPGAVPVGSSVLDAHLPLRSLSLLAGRMNGRRAEVFLVADKPGDPKFKRAVLHRNDAPHLFAESRILHDVTITHPQGFVKSRSDLKAG